MIDDRPPQPRIPLRGALRAAIRILRLAPPPKAAVAGIIALTAVEALVPLVAPWIIGRTFDAVVLDAGPPGERLGRLGGYLLVLVGAEAGAFVASVARAAWTRRAGERVLQSLRQALHDRLLALPAAYHDRHPRGALATRLLEDTETLETMLVQSVSQLGGAPLTFAGIFGALLLMDPALAVVGLIPVPFLLLASWFAAAAFRRQFAAIREAGGALHVHAARVLGGIRAVQLHCAEDAMRSRFADRQTALGAARLALARRSALFFPLLGLLTITGTILALAFGGPAVLNGALTPGNLVSFITYMGLFYMPLLEVVRSNYLLQNLAACGERVFEILDAAPALADPPVPSTLPPARGEVRFDRVSFTYPDAPAPALRNVTFAAAAGEALAVVGPSGAGKSTLARLLPRLYDATTGAVAVDGADVRSVRLDALRARVLLVPQEDALIGDTVADAVRLGLEAAPRESVERALRVAVADDFVSALPSGPDAPIGDGGCSLSAGQRQRLALARAILREPAVLVMDEATSALDPVTERSLWERLEAWRSARSVTLIVIAHRPATVARFPRAVVIEGGRVTADGPPAALAGTNAWFAAFMTQSAVGSRP